MDIQDAVHGYINLSEEEKKIVDSPAFQRLRRIRQLGFTSLIYPSATHTRFQHSLGVTHLTGKFADSLNLKHEKRKELRLAALFHDTGHGPFSHVSEMMSKQYGVSHEDFSCEVIDRLEDLYSADKYRLHRIIRGDLEIGQIVAGDIDADRMDYLIRDAHATGVKHGEIDVDTIIRLAEIDSRRLVYDEKAVTSLESLLASRFHMTKSVYKHHAVEIAEKMIQRALDNHLEDNRLERIMRLDDYDAHNELLESEGVSHKLYERVKNRKLYKRAFIYRGDQEELKHLEQRIDSPEEIEREIAERAGVRPHEVIVDPPSTPGITDFGINIKKSNGEVVNMSDISRFPDMLSEAEWQTVDLKVFSPEEVREEVGEAASEKVNNMIK
ncbi:MAG: metal-dependent phosphohydrolase [Nanohaloarchaea archaeon SW_7_43_1]|nr:MAG: metal-dependent phosphohydrolase [Nanohaloarchaea archaeon SW_7_43_1]